MVNEWQSNVQLKAMLIVGPRLRTGSDVNSQIFTRPHFDSKHLQGKYSQKKKRVKHDFIQYKLKLSEYALNVQICLARFETEFHVNK